MVLQNLNTPEKNGGSLRIPFSTLTPLFTGGIGQYGEQIHPSGLLGSIRYFSCLVAAAIGDTEFESDVWEGASESSSHAKQVALRWETAGLSQVKLPNIQIPRDDGKSSRWFFSCAQQGDLTLILTRRGVSDTHWNLLLIALRIQIRWASFGAKDQFGLGVLASEALDKIQALAPNQQMSVIQNSPSLHQAFFARIVFARPESLPMESRLREGLVWRTFLRNQFRQSGENHLRHYLFGNIKGREQYASAMNISAAYSLDKQHYEIRIWGVIPHTHQFSFQSQYTNIMQRLQQALESSPPEFNGISNRVIEISPESTQLIPWLNKLAGVDHA